MNLGTKIFSLIQIKQRKNCANNLIELSRTLISKKTSSLTCKFNKKFERMIRVRFDHGANKIAISLKCKVTEESEREFNLNRDLDEPISATFQKLHANFSKQLSIRKQRVAKKMKKACDDASKTVESMQINDLSNKQTFNVEEINEQDVKFELFDIQNNLVAYETKNRDAWKENYVLKFTNQAFQVCVDLPALKKLTLPKLLIAGLPAVAKIQTETEASYELINKYSHFYWYCSENQIEDIEKVKHAELEWRLISDGVGKKFCIIHEYCENKLIKLVCIPSNGKQKGLAIEAVSGTICMKGLDMSKFPMTFRHKETLKHTDSNQ
jgi:hypothetical protein